MIKYKKKNNNKERELIEVLLKKDRTRLFKAGALFLIWIIAIFYIGSTINKTTTELAKANPKITAAKNPTGFGLSDDEKTPEQKENSEKLAALNKKSVNNDIRKLTNSLGVNSQGWEVANSKQQEGVPSLNVYFPQGQSTTAWRESLVLRSFVNITLNNPCPTVYNVYEQWMKEQVPDLKIEKSVDDTGVTFSGSSAGAKFYMAGKVFSGSLKETVHIAQYIIKNDGKADVMEKYNAWGNNFTLIR